jgi:hypothetical protein
LCDWRNAQTFCADLFFADLRIESIGRKVQLAPDAPRATEALENLALWQLDDLPKLGLCLTKYKTSNANGLPSIVDGPPPARRAPVMAGNGYGCKRKMSGFGRGTRGTGVLPALPAVTAG